jgi:hypothetical protein
LGTWENKVMSFSSEKPWSTRMNAGTADQRGSNPCKSVASALIRVEFFSLVNLNSPAGKTVDNKFDYGQRRLFPACRSAKEERRAALPGKSTGRHLGIWVRTETETALTVILCDDSLNK